ncbi:MAG TPA: hypothetical protein VFV08_08545 [Puia sp.]|nr:hypothetical protein [Puia sp.]
MENFVELTQDEMTISGGYFLGPIIIDVLGFYRNVTKGFTDGLSDSLK